MNKYQKKAWDLLLEDEKIALTLQLGHHKSTWQAGEIMGKAHYKYIEIQERAQYFLKRFTEHFTIYNNVLIPHECKLEPDTRTYFKEIILNRVKPKIAIESIDNPIFKNPKKRNEYIKNQLNWLENSKKGLDWNILSLIKDYDRWNNFRILPLECQEASAFKRRNKNRNKKDIKNFMEIEAYSIKVIKEKYAIDKTDIPVFYVPIFVVESGNIEIIKISRKEGIINKISTAGLYIFNKIEEANLFAELAMGYYMDRANRTNDCKKGLNFWPKFRKCLDMSINYNQIQNLVNSRRHIRYCQKDL